MNKKNVIEKMKLSDEILEIINDRDEMSNGDFQGCIEAIIENAYQLGVKEGKEGKL